MSKNWFLSFLVLVLTSLTACDVDEATQAVSVDAVQTTNAQYFATVTKAFEAVENHSETATIQAIETKIYADIIRSFEATATFTPVPTSTPAPTKTPTPTVTPTPQPTLQPRIFTEIQTRQLPDWANVEWVDEETVVLTVDGSEYEVEIHINNQIGELLPLGSEFNSEVEFAVNITNNQGMWLEEVDYTGEVIDTYVQTVAKTYRTTAILEEGSIVEIVNYNGAYQPRGEKIHSIMMVTVIGDDIVFLEPDNFVWPEIWISPWWRNQISLSVNVDQLGYCEALCTYNSVAIHTTFDEVSMIAFTYGELATSVLEPKVVYP